jgi:hypothetical protein
VSSLPSGAREEAHAAGAVARGRDQAGDRPPQVPSERRRRWQNAGVAILGMTPRRWIEYTAAILAGNAIYFLVLYPELAPPLQHQPFRFDTGLVLDFLCCVVVYGVIRLGVTQAHRINESR